MTPRIVFATTCKGRTEHLRQTLPKNLSDNPNSKFVVLDYNDQEGLLDYLATEHRSDIEVGRLVVYSCLDSPVFRMGHAKNMAHRCALLEGADILVTLDADNIAGLGFETYIQHKFAVEPNLSFITPDFASLPKPGHRFQEGNPLLLGRGFAGRLAIRAQDFIKIGGYDQGFETWRGEDMDIIERLKRVGLKQQFIDRSYLHAISHGAGVRFKEYPDAQRYETTDVFVAAKHAMNTVVNYGDIGCGTVYRNFDLAQEVELKPLPTRVFGIGFQRTATTSLARAFEILGYDSAHWKSGDWALAIWQEMNRWGRSATLEADYALCDNPIPLLYEKLDKAYPGSKFVLTIRDEADWLRSVEDLWSYDKNPQRWTWDGDRFSHKVHGITYGRTDFDADTFLARYRQHNAGVRTYFANRPNDLLVMDMSHDAGWSELCPFLGQPAIDKPFPRRHQTVVEIGAEQC